MDQEPVISNKGYNFGVTSQQVIDVARTVYRELGSGFLEYAYHKALAIELGLAGVEFQHEVELPVFYRDQLIDTRRADFVVSDIILEIKAAEKIVPEHVAQLAMYLKAAHLKIGLILNFGIHQLQIRRVVN